MSLSIGIASGALMLQNICLDLLSVSQSVCLSVRIVYCGKTADWIWMSFWVVSWVGRGIDRDGYCERGWGRFGVKLGHPIVNNGDFVAYLCEHA